MSCSKSKRHLPRFSSSAEWDASSPTLEPSRYDPLRPPTRIEIEDKGDSDLESPSAPCCRICLEGASRRRGICFFSLHNMYGTIPPSCGEVQTSFMAEDQILPFCGQGLYVHIPDYAIGVVVFLAGMGIYGIILQCSSIHTTNIGHGHHESFNGRREITHVYVLPQTHDPGFCCCCCCIGNDSETQNLDSSGCCSGENDCEEAGIAILVVVVVVLAIFGVFYLLFAATKSIQYIWQKHYHILTKRELTKEYVVEDLHGCYSSPKLDQEHEDHLKFLRLL